MAGLVLALTGAMIMTGCDTSDAAPTGDALYADAEQTYLHYREFLGGLQSTLSAGPWEGGQIGGYGMQPARCDGGAGYQFELMRSLRQEGTDPADSADVVEQYLRDADMTPARRTLGDSSKALIQVAVRDQGGFEQILVQFGRGGTVRLSATTACRPGDAQALSDMLFGDVLLLGDYLPWVSESPTDPLFFGITPGDPQFPGGTPSPTPTP